MAVKIVYQKKKESKTTTKPSNVGNKPASNVGNKPASNVGNKPAKMKKAKSCNCGK